MEKLLPQNIEAEAGVLGSIIIDPEAIVQVADFLYAEDFYRDAHRTIYETILRLYEQHQPADFITICDELERINKLDDVGGPSYVTSLINQVPTSGNVEYYGRIVERTAILRRLIHAAGEIAAVAYEEGDANIALDKAEQLIFSISQRSARADFASVSELLTDYMNKLEQLHEHRGSIVGVPTGFSDLDRMTGGLQRSDLIILAARPAMGKCLAAWSLIDDPATGERVTIEECVRRQMPLVQGLSEKCKVRPTAISHWVDSGIKPCYHVKTRLGRMVEVTGHHPFLTVNGWQPLHDLQVGQCIAVPTSVPTFGTDENCSLEQVRLLANFIVQENQQDGFPTHVWKWSKRYLAEFIHTLLNCNAHTNVPEDTFSAKFSFTSKKLANDVQHAFTRFGIISELHHKELNTWNVNLTLTKSVQVYQREIERATSLARSESDKHSDDLDIYWDEIISIEPIGEHHVYDLTVPDGANFIAQDVFVHNTSLALSLAHNTALKHKQSVAVFSLEMSKEQLVQRLLSMDAGVDQQRLRTGWIEDDEWERIIYSMGTLSEATIWIDDTAGISTMEMRSKARRLQAEHGVDLIIVDYLQLMQSSPGTARNKNREQEISEISRNLKGLAREINVPVMALAQLSRAVESRSSKIPQLSDLRESGCLTGDTPIYLPDEGIYKPIAQLVGQSDVRVLALNEQTWQLEPQRVINAFATGVKPIFKMKTRLGRTIRATANHKFLTIHGWKRLDELAKDERIALPRRLSGPEQATMSNDELALLGHLIGDGCTLPRHAIQYTTNDETLAEIVADLAVKIFGEKVVPQIKKERDWYQVYLYAGYHLTHRMRNPVANWLDNLGIFGLRSHEKRIPDRVFSQPVSSIAIFLRHLWSTDGCIHLSNRTNHYPTIYYASSSPLLARQVQSLLLRLGINATLAQKSQGSKGRDQYHVIVSGKSEIESFFILIGGLGQNKKVHQLAITEYFADRPEKTNRDVIPCGVWSLIKSEALAVGSNDSFQIRQSALAAHIPSFQMKRNFSRPRAAQVANIIQSKSLALLANSDVYWDQVLMVEPDGEEEVYDLTVEKVHNFVANDIIVHNSIEQDADIVMFIYRDDVYNPESERKNIADIILAKHRNGPVGEVSLYFQASQTRFRDLEVSPPAE